MAKSYKLSDGNYLDDKSIIHTKNNKHIKVYDKIEGTVLYDNASGTVGNVTLTESSSNYSRLKIFYVVAFNSYLIRKCEELEIAEGCGIELSAASADSDVLQIHNVGRYTLSGNTITKAHEVSVKIKPEGVDFEGVATRIYIYKVVGYKD